MTDLQAKLIQLETDRANFSRLQDQWKRDKHALLKKIELVCLLKHLNNIINMFQLEGEKRRTDSAVRETALQREAIEKSLNAMERENRELYKNCAQLQQQISQLEMENGNRIIELTKKQREEQDRQTQKIRAEKIQVFNLQ